MQKVEIGSNVYLVPMPVVLVGTVLEGKANFMTVGWVSRVNFQPPMIAVCINKAHYTAQGIVDTGAFSVNIPAKSMMAATDYCGLVSGRRTDKSEVFELFYGRLPGAPMIAECPLTMACKLFQTVDLPSNFLFIGEIEGAYCEERFMTDGRPDLRKIDPFVLSMPDNHYWGVGDPLGRAWSVGKGWKEALQ
jgi:flavin reductase (DIM6/NTAB) family NADH-FMN oxidoreductase RutF